MFCVTMWPLFNLSPSGGGLPVGTGLGRRQPPRGAAGRGQQRCPVLVLLRHADVQGGPGAGQNQRRAGSRQVMAHAHTPCRGWVQGRGGHGPASPAGGAPPDCCCAGGSGAWRGAARAGPELPSRLGAAPRHALCRRQPAAFVAPAEPAVGAMLPAPLHSCLSALHRSVPCRRLPDQAPSQWESLLSPPRPVAALI